MEGKAQAMTYAGDLSPVEAWAMLENEPDAVLVDVRTRPEWTFVGVPDLSSIGKQAVLLSWQIFPQMNVNENFVPQLANAYSEAERPILFLCRSGARSRDAAQAMTASGYRRCYNVKAGFEGGPDEKRHRGTVGGWKADGLPWMQD
jgi:rhodanese-related sulfurtransferase